MRAMTLSGLCLFLDIHEDTWRLYRAREDFIEVTTRAEKVIHDQKFSRCCSWLVECKYYCSWFRSQRQTRGRDVTQIRRPWQATLELRSYSTVKNLDQILDNLSEEELFELQELLKKRKSTEKRIAYLNTLLWKSKENLLRLAVITSSAVLWRQPAG